MKERDLPFVYLGSIFTAISPLLAHPPPDLVHYTLDEMKQRNEREIAGTKKRTDGRTAFLKGHFVLLSRVFSLATRAMSSLGAEPEGEDEVKGKRGGDRERVQARYID